MGSGDTTLVVSYSYQDAKPDSAIITFRDDDGNTATFRVDDSGYAGDDSERPVTLDLTSPDAENGGFIDGNTYDIELEVKDSTGASASVTPVNLLTIDNTAPSSAPGAPSSTSRAGGDIGVSFDDVDESGSGVAAYVVKRSTTSGGPYTPVDTIADDESTRYTAVDPGLNHATEYFYVVTALDGAENEGPASAEVSAVADAVAPTIDAFSVSNPQNRDVAVTLTTDERLGAADSALTVSVTLDGSPEATLSRSGFDETGSFTYTDTLAGSGDGTYTATLDAAQDTVGNDGAGGETATVTVDTQPPATLSLVSPSSPVSRAATGASGGRTTLDVTYSYEDLSPDSTTIVLDDGANTATFRFDDGAYAADGSDRSVTLDLTSPDDESGGLVDGNTYDIFLTATDTVGQSRTNDSSGTGLLTIDNTAPTIDSVATLDRDADGRVDAADIVFSEAVVDSTITPSDYALDGTPLASVETTVGGDAEANDEKVQLRLPLDGGAERPGTGPAELTYAPGTTADPAGNQLGVVGAGDVAETDGARPTITTLSIFDTDTNGRIDEVVLGFSEPIDTEDSAPPTTADLGTITLPDGSTADLSSASVTDPAGSDSTVTVTGLTGQTTARTDEGSAGIAGDLSARWADAAGNALVPTLDDETVADRAGPVLLSATATSGKTPVTVTASEGLYTNGDGTGALVGTDFSYADNSVGDASGVNGVTNHSAGDDTAIVALDAGVQAADLGADAIGAADIYDSAGNLAGGSPVLQDPQPPTNPLSTSGTTVVADNESSYDVTVELADDHEAGTVTVRLSDGGTTVTDSTTVAADTDMSSDSETITVSGIDASGLAEGAVTLTARITDFAGNANPDGFTASSSVAKDTRKPSITDLAPPADSAYANGERLVFEVTYDEPVTVDTSGGVPAIALSVGGTPRSAAYTAGSGSSTLTFAYTVQTGDDDSDGIGFSGATKLRLNGAVLADTAGNAANLGFGGVAPSLTGVTTDGTPPTITTFAVDNPQDQDVRVTIEADESLGSGDAAIEVDLSGPESATLTGTDFSNSGPTTYTATFVGSSDGDYTATLTTARDAVGNDGAGGETATVTVDTQAPDALSLAAPSSPMVRAATASHDGRTDLTVTYSYDELHPDSTTIAFLDDGATAATFGVDDRSYTGGQKSVTLDLSAPTTGSLSDSTDYDIRVTATDSSGNSATITTSTLLTVDNTPPRLQSATVVNDTLTLSYDEPLDSTSVPGTSAFSVSVEGSSRSVADVTLTTDRIQLTLGTAVTPDDSAITVDYNVPGTSALRDRGSENKASGFTEQSVTNDTDDTTAPNPPKAVVSGGPINATTVGSYRVDVALVDDHEGGTVEVRLNGPSGTTITPTASTPEENDADTTPDTVAVTEIDASSLADGTVTASARIIDAAGNASGRSPDVTVTKDTAIPSVRTVSLGNDGANNLALTVTTDEAVARLAVRVDGPDSNGLYAFTEADFDTTAAGDSVTYTLSTSPPYDAGSGTYTAVVNDAVDAAGNDGADGSDTDSYALPGAQPLTLTTTEDSTLSEEAPGVLRNDSAPSELEVAAVDGNTGDIGSPVTLDSGGELTLNADGSYTFDPRGAFDALTPADSATTTFTYTASDGVGGTAQATVTVGIDGVNDPPTLATNNTVTVSSTGGTESVSDADLSAQDPDDPDDALTFDVVSGPSNGTLRVGGSADTSFTQQDLANGRVSYEHDGSNTALDNIAFELSDDTADSLVTDTLEIVIGLSNQAPIARNDTDTTGEDAPLEVTDPANGVLGNDRDPDGDSLSVAAVNGASRSVGSQITLSSGALLTLDADGTYRYDPNDAYEVLAPGDDTTETFSYTAADGRGADNQATVTITVNGANDAPNLAANEGLSLDEGTTAPIPASALRASDVDDGPGALTYRVTTEPTQGRLLVAGSTATRFTQQALDSSRVAYEHTDSTAQNDEFAFSLTDDTGEGPSGQTFAIEVRVVNAPPTAASDRYVVDQGQTLTVSRPATGVLTNDQDPDGDALQASVASPPANGTLSLDPAGTFQYTPNSAFSGTDEFTYTAADGQGGTDDATVEVQVRPRRTSVSVTQSFPNPTQEQSFRLVALPGSADVSLASTLPGTQGEDWRAFREEGASDSQSFRQTNCADGPSCVLSPGTGYWLIARSAWSVADSIETVSLQPGSTATRPVYQIPLQDGWNALSNPLERDVSWGAVQAASGTNQSLYRWDEGWSTTQAFASAASGEAFYFRDDQIDTLTIPFPGLRQPPASSASPKRRTSAPTLRLHAVMGGDTLSTVQAGFQSGAEAGLGPADRYGPPSYFGTAALRLMRSDDGRPHALRVERRPPSREGTTFNVRLEAPPDSVVSIVAEGADAFPDDEVALVRRSNARTHNLRSTDVTLAPQSSTTAFRLAIGSSAYVEEVQKALAPDQVQLLPNYPNPFRRTTTLEYSLPERRSVRLAVYDVLGRRVQVLVDESQRAGFHRLRWDGRGNGGQPVASGVYFLRLTAGPAARTERLVVVR